MKLFEGTNFKEILQIAGWIITTAIVTIVDMAFTFLAGIYIIGFILMFTGNLDTSENVHWYQYILGGLIVAYVFFDRFIVSSLETLSTFSPYEVHTEIREKQHD